METKAIDSVESVKDSVDATPSQSVRDLTQANVAIQKKFKIVETFMGKNGFLMERDVYDMIPTTAMSSPNPELYSVGTTYGKERPKGQLFKGTNRKARRSKDAVERKTNKHLFKKKV